MNFILSNDKQDSVTTLNKQIPFDFTQEIEGLTEDSKVDMEIIPTFREFTEDGMDVKASVDLCVNTNSYNLERLNVIDRITESEEECTNPYSMIIYFTKTGDTLWKIAKKYKMYFKVNLPIKR